MSTHRILGTWQHAHRGWLDYACRALLTALLLLPLACDSNTSGPMMAQSEAFLLRGTVLDLESNPLANAPVWVFRDRERLPEVTTTAHDGTFSFPLERGACEGAFDGARFLVWVSCPDCVAERVQCPYAGDRENPPDVEVKVHMRPDAYRVDGIVATFDPSRLYGGLELQLSPTRRVVATAGEDGAFAFTLPSGDCLAPPALEALNRFGFVERYATLTCSTCIGAGMNFRCGWDPDISGLTFWVSF